MQIGTSRTFRTYNNSPKHAKARFVTEASSSFQGHMIENSEKNLSRMPQLRRIIELYSVHKDDQGMDENGSNSDGSFTRLRPGSFYNESLKNSSSMERIAGKFTNRSQSIGNNFNTYKNEKTGRTIPRYKIGKRSASTYQNHFEMTPAKVQKEKSLNKKADFQYEQVSYNHKFPPIPKAEVEERIPRSPFETKMKGLQSFQELSPSFKRFILNRTMNKSIISLSSSKGTKVKSKLSRKNSILKKLADSSLQKELNMLKERSVNISDIMKTSYDRPKVTAVQDTLHGIFQTSSSLKNEQRHRKFKTWGGIKIPISIKTGQFNRNKDVLNKWDEQRDGIFNKL
ncbi:unnamed protein product [Moneuplotes crassus]|uniref:Uncharacterized protein n=1 Tax=Euplotes crassus TaxID=5936 RepID=A0AAD1UKP3_EUPCR|nr:unnamed protein product [Moneuplotes crassus]